MVVPAACMRNWMALNGMPIDRVEVASLATQIGWVPETVAQRFNIDCRCLRTQPASGFKLKVVETGSTRSYTDEWGITWEYRIFGLQGRPCAYCTDSRFFELAAFFGSVSESTPFSYFASASASFTGQASVKLRLA